MTVLIRSFSFLLLVTGFAALLSGCAKPTIAEIKDIPPADKPLPQPQTEETATLVVAGGCFWCTEIIFEELKGVKSVVSGYAGGTKDDAKYGLVAAGRTDHAESIEITYDPDVISYTKLLEIFFAVHDPTQLNRQDPDVGRQYRSAIFFASDEEKATAKAYIEKLNDSQVFDKPIATTLEPLKQFYPAEEYHQDYVARYLENPSGDFHVSYVRAYSLPKLEKFRKQFKELRKKQ